MCRSGSHPTSPTASAPFQAGNCRTTRTAPRNDRDQFSEVVHLAYVCMYVFIRRAQTVNLFFFCRNLTNLETTIFTSLVNKPVPMECEQPCSDGEPIRHAVLWEGLRTTHKPSGSPMGHVPMGTTETRHCV